MSLTSLSSLLPSRFVIIIEARQSDMPMIMYLMSMNFLVQIKNIKYLPARGVFGSFIHHEKIEQLPPHYFLQHTNECKAVISGGGVENNNKERGKVTNVNSELSLFMRLCQSKIIIVTGSFGKQTTTALLSNILTQCGLRVYRRNREHNTVLECIGKDYDYIILDVSLDEISDQHIRSDALVITNISPYPFNPESRFMDRILSISAQINKNKHKLTILNDDNYFCKLVDKHTSSESYFFSYKRSGVARVTLIDNKLSIDNDVVIDLRSEQESLNLYGNRNPESYLAAVTTAFAINPDIDRHLIRNAVLDFKGAESHMELIGTKRGRRYFNNLYSTSPAQTVAALTALKENIILITGGAEKDVNFKALGMEIVYFCKAIILLGKASTEIKKTVESYKFYKREALPVFKVADLPKAVLLANHLSKKGDVILLSYSSHDNTGMYPYMNQREIYIGAVDLLS